MKRCKMCLISDKVPEVKINTEGICNYCLNNHNIDDSPKRKKYKKIFEDYLKEIRGKNKYDCVLLFSGGKDSIYLLHILTVKYKLQVLTITIDTGFLSPIGKKNIKKVVSLLNVDHIYITPENNFYKRFYKYYIKHMKIKCDICDLCQKIMHSIALNIAVKKNIPFVALAYSPDQTDVFEYSKEEMTKSWVPKELYQKPFTKKDRSYFWNPKLLEFKDIPRFIFPFYAIYYPSEIEIYDIISNLGLVSKKNLNPHITNCSLYWLFMKLDIENLDYNPYNESLSIRIRQGKTKRGLWPIKLPIGIWMLKHGLLKRKDVIYSIKKLNFFNKK